jgi:hypothetical protein
MNLQLSEETSLLILGLNAALNQHLVKLHANMTTTEFDTLRMPFGYAMSALLDIVNPIYKEHPSLLPVQMDGCYVIEDSVYQKYLGNTTK